MKFVVCGGGTAGWVTAFTIHASNPNAHEVVVIESQKIGIIGAGEATSGFLYDLLHGATLFGNNQSSNPNRVAFDFAEFAKKVDAVPKYALKHINWAKEKGHYWAPINGSETSKRSPDHMFNYVVAEFGPEKAYLSSVLGQAYDLNKLPPAGGYGFQFDAHKVAKFLREHITTTTKTTHIDSIIKDVTVDSAGLVENVIIEDGTIVDGDFFIDATGFVRLLANKVGIGWIDYENQLLVDRAMPFIVPYKENQKVQPVTVAEALSSGWMWRTPTGGRRGCGYVYSSSFISEDEAQREAEKIMGHPIEPIKHIKYESGRVDQFWKGNVLVVGLASSFIEPLEATSIHATIMQIFSFCQEYLSYTKEKTLNPASIEKYNAKTEKMYEYYKDFTVFHYQGGREDSEFWRTIKFDKITSPAVENYIERSKSRIPSVLHFMDFWGVDSLWKWTLAGLGYVSREQAMNELRQFDQFEFAQMQYRSFREEMRKVHEKSRPFELDPKEFII